MAHTNAEHPALVRRVIRGDPQGQRPAVSLLNLYIFIVKFDLLKEEIELKKRK